MDKFDFYAEVARVLGTTHEALMLPKRRLRDGREVVWRSRWGPRQPGNGRFPGHGIARWFGPADVHLAFSRPVVSGRFNSAAAALNALRDAVTRLSDDKTPPATPPAVAMGA